MKRKKLVFKPVDKLWKLFQEKYGLYFLPLLAVKMDCSAVSLRTKMKSGFQKGDCHLLAYYAEVDPRVVFSERDTTAIFDR